MLQSKPKVNYYNACLLDPEPCLHIPKMPHREEGHSEHACASKTRVQVGLPVSLGRMYRFGSDGRVAQRESTTLTS